MRTTVAEFPPEELQIHIRIHGTYTNEELDPDKPIQTRVLNIRTQVWPLIDREVDGYQQRLGRRLTDGERAMLGDFLHWSLIR